MSKPIQMERGVKYRDADKMALIPVKTIVTEREELLGAVLAKAESSLNLSNT